jgi:long-chain acyl-CoA synthetase
MTGHSQDILRGTADFCMALMAQEGGGVEDANGFAPMPQIREWAAAAAKRLEDAGITPQEPVLVPIAGSAEDVAGILAVIIAGGVAVPIHARAHADAARQVIDQTGARFSLRYLSAPNTRATPDLESVGPSAPQARPLLKGAAMITFTSGSTGRPKGVVLSRARMSAKLCSLQDKLEMGEGAVSIVPLLLIFSFGQWATFLTLLRGGIVVMAERFDADAVTKALMDGRCDYLAAVPTMLKMLLDSAGAPARFTILTGGEAVNSDLRRRIFRTWPLTDIYSIYGLTESGTCDLFHRDTPDMNAADTLGHPAPDLEVRTDPATGELLIKTPFAMLGYLDMPDETATTLNDGWLRTGDIADILPSGEVRYNGRLKEIINRAGNKVSPLEIEALFLQHPSVSDVLATGAYDPRLGEAIHLLVVSSAGETLQPGTLLDWARDRIDRFKLPDHIHLGASLPVGRTGKADRKGLRLCIEEGLSRPCCTDQL